MLQSTRRASLSPWLDLPLTVGILILLASAGARADLFPCTQGGILDAIDSSTGPGPHTFDCPPGTTITTEFEIVIEHDVILDGEGNLTLDADRQHRVLSVGPDPTVELRNLTLTRGFASNPLPDSVGGGILNEGTLTLTNCTVSASRADIGGGIGNGFSASLTLTNTAVSGNTADQRGGGISAGEGSDIDLTESTVSENSAEQGGGLHLDSVSRADLVDSTVFGNTSSSDGGGIRSLGMVALLDSTVSENEAGLVSGEGGGIWAAGGTELIGSTVSGNTGGGIAGLGPLVLLESTVSGNAGGGISLEAGTADLTRSTVSANTVTGWGGGIAIGIGTFVITETTISANIASSGGGGIFNEDGTLTLLNSTISGNEAQSGGGLWNDGMATLTHVTVASNSADDVAAIFSAPFVAPITVANTLIEGDCEVIEAPLTSNGGNLESPGNTCSLTHPTDQLNVTPANLAIAPLADNWGPTQTHALLEGSFAIDAGVLANCLPTDQRSVPRPEPGGTACDIGAYEEVPEPRLAAMLVSGVVLLATLRRVGRGQGRASS